MTPRADKQSRGKNCLPKGYVPLQDLVHQLKNMKTCPVVLYYVCMPGKYFFKKKYFISQKSTAKIKMGVINDNETHKHMIFLILFLQMEYVKKYFFCNFFF